MKRLTSLLLLSLVVCDIWACTAVIASGKATTDGRPFIFKNRDSSDGINNSLLCLKGSKYYYMGVVNYSTSSSPTSIWYGHNEAGFAILNTVAYYVNSATSKANTSAGALMKKALGQCATVDEFEALLSLTQAQTSGVTLSTNFAVMDTLGNVAVFEASNRKYTKYDVNDPEVAPDGYLIRTNFSFSSPYYETTNHVGEQRYKSAQKYISDTFGEGKIDPVRLAHELPRYLYHGTKQINLWDDLPADINNARTTYFNNFIPRYTSTSASLIHGIKAGERPEATVNWLAIGWPCGSLTVPIVITPSRVLPEVVERAAGTYKSEMCTGALEFKKQVFTVYHSGTQNTDSIDLSKLINNTGNGILQKTILADAEVESKGLPLMERWRSGEASDDDVAAFYTWVDTFWRRHYNAAMTSVNSIAADNANADNNYYTLTGIRLPQRPAQPGIYINGQRKVVIR